MNLSIAAIKFNHDPKSSTYEAINIRKNETEPACVPEWQRCGRNDPAAYALNETFGNRITIQVKFNSDPGEKTLEIRAIDPTCGSISSDLEDLVQGVISLLFPVPLSRRKNILGTVKKKQVTFCKTGESEFETFELQDVGIWGAGVSASTTTWLWQYRDQTNSHWKNFSTTNHRIYTVLRLPREPWSQLPLENNIALPWAEVLEYACIWADSTHSIDQAAVRITQGVRRLEKRIRAVYDPTPAFYSDPNFDCTAFLKLVRGNVSHGLKLSCVDFATIVSSFSNILGCELWQSGLARDRSFTTNPVRMFGRTVWEKRRFTGHVVAWEGACTESEDLFDACLEIDGDEDPTKAPHDPLLPANLRFGHVGEKGYVFRLTPPPEPGTVRPTPVEEDRDRRSIGPNAEKPGPKVRGRVLRLIKEHYNYNEWMPVSPQGPALFTANALTTLEGFADWKLVEPVQTLRTSNRPPVVKLFFGNTENSDFLMRVDIDVCPSEWETPHFVLQRLGQFHSPSLKQQLTPDVGRLKFVEAETGAILFTRGNLVILVRNAGRADIALAEFASHVDRFVRRNPEDEGEEITGMNDFSIPDYPFSVGEQVRLTYDGSPESIGFFRFLTPSGYVLRKPDFVYVPLKAGKQQLTIFAERSEKPIFKQSLDLDVTESS